MTGVVLLAAGRGSRMQQQVNKVYLRVNGVMLLAHSLATFGKMPEVEGIFVVIKKEEAQLAEEAVREAGIAQDKVQFVIGGEERQDSVRHALEQAPATWRRVLIHDGARPFVSAALARRVLNQIEDDVGVIPAVAVKDTIKYVENKRVVHTPLRSHLMRAQTPQGFGLSRILTLHEKALADGLSVTDDAALYEAYGYPVHVVLGEEENEKMTVPEDLKSQTQAEMRVGMGYDVHALAEGRALILGGVAIAHEKGLAGHSDADVLSHAITDAFLGAAALGDIGQHFPDTDVQYQGADSLELLKRALQLVQEKGYQPMQLDATICAQRPKLAPYLPEMKKQLILATGLAKEAINIKATTTEKLGFVGKEEGISAYAVVTIKGLTD